MTEQTWTFQERSTWPIGTWSNEPDKVQWTDAATQLPCLAVRNHFGVWCGYVGVAESHLFFKVHYDVCPDDCGEPYCDHAPAAQLTAHGGINYSSLCQEDDQPHGICHIPEPGQPDHVWWFGFDTGYGNDFVPGLSFEVPGLSALFSLAFPEATYKPLGYVQQECTELAAQLAAIA